MLSAKQNDSVAGAISRTSLGTLLGALFLAASCGTETVAQGPTSADAAEEVASAPDTSAVQSAAPVPQAPAGGAGRLVFESPRHDFGEVFDVDVLECEFTFRNGGSDTVVIDGVKASCGCTTPTLEKNSYEPGERGSLRASWEPKGFGRQSKTLTVSSEGLPGGFATLTISADITPFVEATPASLQLGDVSLGKQHRERVTLVCRDPEWEILSVRATHPAVQAQVVGGTGDTREVEVMIGSGAPWGFLSSRVEVEVVGRLTPGSEPIEHKAGFSVSGTVVGEVRISRPMFSISKIQPGPFRTELVLRREDGSPFQVTDVHVNPGAPAVGLEVRAEEDTEDGVFVQRLVLTGDATGFSGYLQGSVDFTTDVPGERPRTLRFGGNVVAQ